MTGNRIRDWQQSDGGDERIEPADFSPPPPSGRQWRFRPRVWHAAVGIFLLAAIAAAWFVLTARSVFIETSPPTADIDISGGLAVRVGPRYLMRSGEYRLSLVNAGYYDLEAPLRVTDEQAQTHQVAMEPRPGIVGIRALDPAGEPVPGVRVQLDGVDIGTAPLEELELEPGNHQLSLSHERYQPHDAMVNVTGRLQEQQFDISLEPAWADFRFSTEPAGADVIVDGQLQGQTPLTVSLLQGHRQVTLKQRGYKAWEEQLEVTAGEDRILPEVELEAADGLVFIRSQPPGANVTVDGEFRGQTPLEVSLSPDSEHEISLFRAGYRTAVRELSARPDEELDIDVTLEPQTAAVRIVADPPDASLYVDGELRGDANQTVELLAAEQRIEIRREGYVPHVEDFIARPGLDQEIRVSLQTEEEARLAAIEPRIETVTGQPLQLFHPHPFTMGASRREPGRRANEVLRDVIMERPFYLALHPVTNRQYREFRPDHLSGSVQGETLDRPGQPVVQVDWFQAVQYCNWLSEQESLQPFYVIEDEAVTGINAGANGYRLPTEAEWEWAARSDGEGNIRRFPWGEQWPPPEGAGNFADESTSEFLGQYLRDYDDGVLATSNVDRFPPTPLGLHDMAGNVSEWVHDYYGAVSGLSSAAERDPLGPEQGSYRTVKGSGWMHGSVTELRASYRDFGEQPRNDLGFRVARYLDE